MDQDLYNQIQEAMWEGDIDTLDRIAGCDCCCDEHFFEDCPARLWEGCRGSGSLTRLDIQGWEEYYGGADKFWPPTAYEEEKSWMKFLNLSENEFYGR